MFNVLIDTCVWLDMAQNPKQTPLLQVIEGMVHEGTLSLIIPRQVYDEFHKNRERVASSSARSLSSHFQQVKEAVSKGVTDSRRKKKLLTELEDLNHKIPLIGGAAESTLYRIDKLFQQSKIIEKSDPIVIRAAERALQRKAPCHRENKNSLADAVVIETYFEAVRVANPGDRFAFVTHNKSDFSLPNGNQKLVHPDLASGFSKIKSIYFVSLNELLRKIDPSLVSELLWEQSWEEEPRALSEILSAQEKLALQIWYNRHKNREWMVENNKIKIVPRSEWEHGKKDNQSQFIDEIWQGALQAARRVERELGKENTGPWSDFEWGMLNGKLSAIRWVLGEEWDMLDT